MTTELDAEDRASLARTFLRVEVEGRTLALGLEHLSEILRAPEIQPMPSMSEAYRGVTSLRGEVVPVLDLRARFGGGHTKLHARSVVVVGRVEARGVGLLVEEVRDIVRVEPGEIGAPPDFVRAGDVEGLVQSVMHRAGELVFILSIPAVVRGALHGPVSLPEAPTLAEGTSHE